MRKIKQDGEENENSIALRMKKNRESLASNGKVVVQNTNPGSEVVLKLKPDQVIKVSNEVVNPTPDYVQLK